MYRRSGRDTTAFREARQRRKREDCPELGVYFGRFNLHWMIYEDDASMLSTTKTLLNVSMNCNEDIQDVH